MKNKNNETFTYLEKLAIKSLLHLIICPLVVMQLLCMSIKNIQNKPYAIYNVLGGNSHIGSLPLTR
jgi:hypothetical protein